MKSYMLKKSVYLLCGLVVLLALGGIIWKVTSETSTPEMMSARKMSPYSMNIQFPADKYHDGILSAVPGETIVIPVDVSSGASVPFSFKVVRGDYLMVCSEYVSVRANDDFITLQPSENTPLNVYLTVSDNATSGDYFTALYCELEQKVPGMTGHATGFKVHVD